MSCSRVRVSLMTNNLMAKEDYCFYLLPAPWAVGSRLIGASGLSRLPFPAIPGCCGIELVSLAIGSLLSKGSLGLAKGEAAGLTFLQ